MAKASDNDAAPAGASGDPPSGEELRSSFLARLKARQNDDSRYRRLDELGRGGMGIVVRVFDEDLRRHLAMKVIRSGEGTQSDARSLGRFLDEAQVTAQLSHPNIAPVHELGVDRDGNAFFTMRLVQGDTFADVIRWVHEGRDGREGREAWTQTRALSVLLDVCDALAFAHSKGVLHRDLKPANVMVGRFGETCVMDWGLARVVGRPDPHDLRLRPPPQDPPSTIRTTRTEAEAAAAAQAADSPIVTMDGVVVGTPAYMSPEQASGQVERMGPPSDVYALGAMLYHLLTGQMPYVGPNDRLSPRMIVALVLSGPPPPIHTLRPDVPAELQAICEKAMARDPAARYRDMGAIAADLRAYLEHRVVKAYASGAFAELRKWIGRNRGLAAALAAVVLLILGGVAAVAAVQARANDQLSGKNRELELRLADVQRLSDLKRLRDLGERAAALWPAWPENADALRQWLDEARTLAGRRVVHEASLQSLRERALEPETTSPRFACGEDAWWHEQLVDLVKELDRLAVVPPAAAALPADVSIPSLERRLAHAERVEADSLDASVDAWKAAHERIALNPRHRGVDVPEQMGLVPLGPDPESGLEEFWHVETGEQPERDPATGRLVIADATGVVFVLLPGGHARLGAQQPDASHPAGSPNVSQWAYPDEGPVNEVELAPFLIAKHEMTQGQWLRVTGSNPAWFTRSGVGRDYPLATAIESVNFDECVEVLRRLGLRLPTEAEWEYAARGGTTTQWWFGEDERELVRVGNVADQALSEDYAGIGYEEWNDGFPDVAPVGRFAPNPFGLHDVAGNVFERCADRYSATAYVRPCRPEDGLRLIEESQAENQRIFRGGAWSVPGEISRSALRGRGKTEDRDTELGLRPARSLRR